MRFFHIIYGSNNFNIYARFPQTNYFLKKNKPAQ